MKISGPPIIIVNGSVNVILNLYKCTETSTCRPTDNAQINRIAARRGR